MSRRGEQGVQGRRRSGRAEGSTGLSPPCSQQNLQFGVLPPLFFFFLIFFLKEFHFIYLFLAVLGLRFCARAFSSCGKQGLLFIAVRGPLTIAASCCGAQAPDAQAQ